MRAHTNLSFQMDEFTLDPVAWLCVDVSAVSWRVMRGLGGEQRAGRLCRRGPSTDYSFNSTKSIHIPILIPTLRSRVKSTFNATVVRKGLHWPCALPFAFRSSPA